jgi:glutathione synthase/RimK-type ligase-like ATP-grasp enzyme
VPSPEITLPQYREFAIAESEAALHGVFAGLECFWVSKPETIRKAELKLYQLSMALKLGLDVSPTIVTNDEESAAQFYMRHNGEVVFKPLRRSRIVDGDEVQLLYTSKVGSAEARQFDRVAYTPTLLQRNLAKRLDIRVTVIGTRAFAVEIHSQDREVSSQDWRRAETASLVHSPHALPQDLETKCIQLVREMDLAFGALDFILTPEGDYQFLEINPNGQWAWIEQLCPEIPLRETLADLLLSGEA